MKRLAKWGGIASLVGTVFPVTYVVTYYSGLVRSFPSWGMYLWPTSIMLMATDGFEHDHAWVAEVITISILVNAAVWFVIGACIWLLRRALVGSGP
jgi:hypothetical protein